MEAEEHKGREHKWSKDKIKVEWAQIEWVTNGRKSENQEGGTIEERQDQEE